MTDREARPAGEFGSPDHLRGVPVENRPGGVGVAGPIYCPIYFAGNTADKVLIDDPAFCATVDNDAAKIALLRQVDTALAGLYWSRKVGVVTLKGIRSRRGKVGPFDVLFFAGPTYENGVRHDDRVVEQRRAAGLPTGEPGERKIKVATRWDL